MNQVKRQNGATKQLPVAKAQDVEFSMDQADDEDLEAMERAEACDKRQDNG
ncbi:MAG: YfhD-like protein [Paenibacillaceae bacterium]|jgi:hypothetical protein|nr:YfhD-like protein [Paenibacillaceae bacterium]